MEEERKQDAVSEEAEEETMEETAEEKTEEAAKEPEAEKGSAEAEEEEEEQPKEKKKGFGHKPKKDPRDEQIEELKDRVTRQMAEFDNFRKRTEKEKSAMYEIGVKSVIEKLLPIVDSFERGFAAVTEADDEEPFVKGMKMVYRQLLTTFETIGVKAIETEGQEFNPDLHHAVMHVDDESIGENMIVEEFQKGYTYHDAVVRYSMVKVAN